MLRNRVVRAEVGAASLPRSKTRVAGGAAALAATGALACGACCGLPFALPAAVLAVSGGVLAWFAGLTPWITGLAFVAVTGAWLWVGLLTLRTRRRTATSTLITLAAASALLAIALAWPRVEPVIISVLRG